jgi:hypothetical protein
VVGSVVVDSKIEPEELRKKMRDWEEEGRRPHTFSPEIQPTAVVLGVRRKGNRMGADEESNMFFLFARWYLDCVISGIRG